MHAEPAGGDRDDDDAEGQPVHRVGYLVHIGYIVGHMGHMGHVATRMDPQVQTWAPVGQAISLLLVPYTEVTLDLSARDVFGPDEELLADGRRLSSVSAVIRGPADPS